MCTLSDSLSLKAFIMLQSDSNDRNRCVKYDKRERERDQMRRALLTEFTGTVKLTEHFRQGHPQPVLVGPFRVQYSCDNLEFKSQ